MSMKRLYQLTTPGASHVQRENGKQVFYRNKPRPGTADRDTIILTEQQAKSPAFRHLGLRLVKEDAA